MIPGNAKYPKGTLVITANSAVLAKFKHDWIYHHPLSEEQLSYANRVAPVSWVAYYHNNTVLYQLEGIPGIWHEQCLRDAERDSDVDT